MRNILILLFILICSSPIVSGQNLDTVSGCYEYTYGDSESLLEAKEKCKSMAMRDAIENYVVFIESKSLIEDYKLVKDFLNKNSASVLQDVKVSEETITDRNVKYCITAQVNPVEVRSKINRRIVSQNSISIPSVIETTVFSVLSIRESRKGLAVYLNGTIKLKMNLINSYTVNDMISYQNSDMKTGFLVCRISYFDVDGFPVDGETIAIDIDVPVYINDYRAFHLHLKRSDEVLNQGWSYEYRFDN